jgi:hypothetical protein
VTGPPGKSNGPSRNQGHHQTPANVTPMLAPGRDISAVVPLSAWQGQVRVELRGGWVVVIIDRPGGGRLRMTLPEAMALAGLLTWRPASEFSSVPVSGAA